MSIRGCCTEDDDDEEDDRCRKEDNSLFLESLRPFDMITVIQLIWMTSFSWTEVNPDVVNET